MDIIIKIWQQNPNFLSFTDSINAIHLIQKLESNHYNIILENINPIFEECKKLVEKLTKVSENKISIKSIKNTTIKHFVESYCQLNNIEIETEEFKDFNVEELDDEEKLYMSEIKKIPILDRNTEYSLAKKAKSGDLEAKKKLAESNLRLVAHIANLKLNRGASFLDLVQEGNLALLKAIDKFNPDLGYRFSTFVIWDINDAMDFAVAKANCGMEVKRHYCRMKAKFYNLMSKMELEYNREVSTEEVLDFMNLKPDQKNWLRNILSNPLSIEEPINKEDREDITLGETLISNQPYTEEIVLQNYTSEQIEKGLNHSLTEREKQIIILYFNLAGNGKYTEQEIGDQLGVTKQAVNAVKLKALKKLKHSRYIKELVENQ